MFGRMTCMWVKVLGQRAGDAAADEIEAALAVRQQRRDVLEGCCVEISQRLAQVADDGIGEAVENMCARGIRGPAVVFGDRVGDRRFDFLMQMRLEIRIAFEAELLHHAHHRRRRDAGIFRNGGDAAQPGDWVVVQQTFSQLLLGARQRVEMRVDDIRDRLRRGVHSIMLPGNGLF